MGQFEMYPPFPGAYTFISNTFLDYYMPSANGEFVKIYLYLLRHASCGKHTLNFASVADALNCTETDVQRALRYWEKAGVLKLSLNSLGTLTGVSFAPLLPGADSSLECAVSAVSSADAKEPQQQPVQKTELSLSSAQPALTPDKKQDLKNRDEVRQILFIAEQYLGKTLSATDMETLLYLYDEVHLNADLMEYLLEYCVSKGSSSMAYIKKVGLAWAEQGITTVTQAKEETNLYNRNYFTILRAFGIKNRNPLDKEIQYMNLWLNQYGFTLEIISEACSRTVLATGKASFSYADSILESWFKQGVHHLSDIDSLDLNFHQKKAAKVKEATPKQKAPASKNRFNNFHQRNYNNMAELETQLLGK